MSAGARQPGGPLMPGATLGVMGGGQLGRMFVHAAQAMGYTTAVLEPDRGSPAGFVAHHHIACDYLDLDGINQLVSRCDAVTTEFENVPARALLDISALRPVHPSAEAVAICQDRALEKAHFLRAGVPCAPHALISNPEQLAAVDDALLPGVLKTTRLGYDGKGQRRVADRAALATAWHELGQLPCVLEQQLDLALELSVLVARNAAGDMVQLPVQQNLHRDGILAVTQVPAPDASAELQQQAVTAARVLAETMGYVGVLCVEFFVLNDGSLLANEMAPRPHNSGHWSLDGADCSQFNLQVRTLAGLPLAAPRQHSAAVMLNLLGDLWFADGKPVAPRWAPVLALPGVHLHLYGKANARPGRKMGHLTVTAAKLDDARAVANQVAELLGLPAV